MERQWRMTEMIKCLKYMIAYIASVSIKGAENVGQVIQIGRAKVEVVDSNSGE